MDKKDLRVINAHKCIDFLCTYESNSYSSVIFYENGELKDTITNNYNDFEKAFHDTDVNKDCVILNVAKHISTFDPAQCEVILWDESVDDDKNKTHQFRKEYGLYNGISLMFSIGDGLTALVSACSKPNSDRDGFHSAFISKRNDMIRLIREGLY